MRVKWRLSILCWQTDILQTTATTRPWRSVLWDLSLPFSKGLCPSWKAQTWLLKPLLNLLTISGLSCFWPYDTPLESVEKSKLSAVTCQTLISCAWCWASVPETNKGRCRGARRIPWDPETGGHCLSATGTKMTFWNMLGLRSCFPGQLQACLHWKGPQSGILESAAHTEPLVRANIASSKETLSPLPTLKDILLTPFIPQVNLLLLNV